MTEDEKQSLVKSIKAKYGKRKGFKLLNARAQREIFRKDILQPGQREFRETYRKTAENMKLIDASIEREQIRKEKELNEVYVNSDKVLTIEKKILKEVGAEHPTMVDEEDTIKWTK